MQVRYIVYGKPTRCTVSYTNSRTFRVIFANSGESNPSLENYSSMYKYILHTSIYKP